MTSQRFVREHTTSQVSSTAATNLTRDTLQCQGSSHC